MLPSIGHCWYHTIDSTNNYIGWSTQKGILTFLGHVEYQRYSHFRNSTFHLSYVFVLFIYDLIGIVYFAFRRN